MASYVIGGVGGWDLLLSGAYFLECMSAGGRKCGSSMRVGGTSWWHDVGVVGSRVGKSVLCVKCVIRGCWWCCGSRCVWCLAISTSAVENIDEEVPYQCWCRCCERFVQWSANRVVGDGV